MDKGDWDRLQPLNAEPELGPGELRNIVIAFRATPKRWESKRGGLPSTALWFGLQDRLRDEGFDILFSASPIQLNDRDMLRLAATLQRLETSSEVAARREWGHNTEVCISPYRWLPARTKAQRPAAQHLSKVKSVEVPCDLAAAAAAG